MANESEESNSMSEMIGVAVPIAKEVHKILKDRGVYEKAMDYLARRKPKDIIVLGASGTGKSSFLKSIRGLSAYIRHEDRTDKATKVKGKIGKEFFNFIDTPGEAQHKAKRSQVLYEIYGKPFLGIINLVSYGYHENAIAGTHAIAGTSASETYLESRRQTEINQLAEWTSLLAGRGGPAKWLITVVTKADLWWSPTNAPIVLEYYKTGKYWGALGEATEITYSVRSYSSLNQLFYGRAAMSGFYTDTQRVRDRSSLIALLLEYCIDQPKK